MQKEKLCLVSCRARNKRCNVGTPGTEPQGGDSSDEATGGRVHTKVILFHVLSGNGRNNALLDNGLCSFFGRKVDTLK